MKLWIHEKSLRRTCRAIAVGVALAVAGCSFSYSSESISKSVSSPLTSSSASSGSSTDESYAQDVRDATAAHILAGGGAGELRQRIGTLAAEHGVSNWEASAATYEAIGAGLAKAKYRELEVDTFIASFADNDQQRAWMRKGYDRARR